MKRRIAAASYLQGPFRRSIENKLQAYTDFVPGVYQNGSIVGGPFWDMKNTFGNELTAKLAFRTRSCVWARKPNSMISLGRWWRPELADGR